jgi:hypothetical protein
LALLCGGFCLLAIAPASNGAEQRFVWYGG